MLFLSECYDLQPLIRLAKILIIIIQIGVPVLLLLFGVFDLVKAVMAAKEDEIKTAQKLLIKRIVYAVAVFFVITIVKFVFNTVSKIDGVADASEWAQCWDCGNEVKLFNGNGEYVCASECKIFTPDKKMCMNLKVEK